MLLYVDTLSSAELLPLSSPVSPSSPQSLATDTFTVTQFQYTNWSQLTRPPPSTLSLLEVIDQVTKVQMSTGNRPITVMCKSVTSLVSLMIGTTSL